MNKTEELDKKIDRMTKAGLILKLNQERQKAERLCKELEKKMDLVNKVSKKEKVLILKLEDWIEFAKTLRGDSQVSRTLLTNRGGDKPHE